MKKRVIAVILGVTTVAGLLTACGSNGGDGKNSGKTTI